MPVALAKWAANRPADQVEKPYPSLMGLACTAFFISWIKDGVAREDRPGGLIGCRSYNFV